MRQRRKEPPGHLLYGRDMHGGGEAVVRRLAQIDVVIGVDRRLAAERAAEKLIGAIGDHLVHVHVGLRARSGLPHDQREMTIELAGDDLVGDLDDRPGAPRVEHSEFEIGFRGCPFDDRKRYDHRVRHPLLANSEVDA